MCRHPASTHSAGSTASLPAGIGAPVMMRTASPRPIVRSNGDPGNASPTTVSAIRLYGVAPSVQSATTRVAVHRGAIEAWYIDGADDGRGEHATGGFAQRHVFSVELMQLRVEPRQRRLHRVAPREALHAHVVRRS